MLAPRFQDVTVQKLFGKCASLMPNRSLITDAALDIDKAFQPTIKAVKHAVYVKSHLRRSVQLIGFSGSSSQSTVFSTSGDSIIQGEEIGSQHSTGYYKHQKEMPYMSFKSIFTVCGIDDFLHLSGGE